VNRFGKAPAIALAALLLAVSLSGCGQTMQHQPGPGTDAASLQPLQVIAEDGYRLPLHHWPAKGQPEAIALGIHGFNEHGGTFEVLAEALTSRGITLYAHDQRGFGATAQRGIWPGHERLAADVTLLAELLSERHPETPRYLVGHSMGGAVALLALSGDSPPPVKGSVLISPAAWGFETMPWYQRLSLWIGVRLFPALSFPSSTAERLGIEPTDDPEVKRWLAEDEIIPPEAMCALLERLPEDDAIRLALYPQGYHMLTRYTQRERTEADIAAWLLDPNADLPSGHEKTRHQAQDALCD